MIPHQQATSKGLGVGWSPLDKQKLGLSRWEHTPICQNAPVAWMCFQNCLQLVTSDHSIGVITSALSFLSGQSIALQAVTPTALPRRTRRKRKDQWLTTTARCRAAAEPSSCHATPNDSLRLYPWQVMTSLSGDVVVSDGWGAGPTTLILTQVVIDLVRASCYCVTLSGVVMHDNSVVAW